MIILLLNYRLLIAFFAIRKEIEYVQKNNGSSDRVRNGGVYGWLLR